jgi:hypothetical protein
MAVSRGCSAASSDPRCLRDSSARFGCARRVNVLPHHHPPSRGVSAAASAAGFEQDDKSKGKSRAEREPIRELATATPHAARSCPRRFEMDRDGQLRRAAHSPATTHFYPHSPPVYHHRVSSQEARDAATGRARVRTDEGQNHHPLRGLPVVPDSCDPDRQGTLRCSGCASPLVEPHDTRRNEKGSLSSARRTPDS